LPPTLHNLAKAAKQGEGKRISIFIGLYDEGLAVEGGSFIREGEDSLIKTLEDFNKIGDFKVLDLLRFC